jgi:hypothetical protein
MSVNRFLSAVNQVQQPTAAGKLTALWSSRARGVAWITAPLVTLTMLVFVPSALATFGLQRFSEAATNQNGSLDVQAGSHPYALTTTFTLTKPPVIENRLIPEGNLKDVRDELPPGFVGDPNATPKCAYAEFITHHCPNDTAVGIETTYLTTNATSAFNKIQYFLDAVYNIEPPLGVAAEFGFFAANTAPVLLDSSVRTGGDYGITVNVRNIIQAISAYASKVTIWGVPAEASHNRLRGSCLHEGDVAGEEGLGVGEDEQEGPAESQRESEEKFGIPDPRAPAECPVNVPVLPLLTNPTSCGVARTATLSVDSWQEPGNFVSDTASMPEVSGCERLDFSPTIGVTPDGTQGSTPTGLNVSVHVPQEATLNPVGLAEADVKDTTVTLPAGMQLSPSAADGLLACSQAQIGLENADKPTCPEASKVANVKIKTPLLEGELEGAVYLAAPQNFAGLPENPFSSLIALYLVAEEPVTGVLVKLAGKVSPNPDTGQLTTTFENTPQLPFSDLKLEFYGTGRAPLTTPALCGAYGTTASFTPWSGGEPAVVSPKPFQITSGPAGAPCSDPQPFSPGFQAGTTNLQAGAFTPFTLTMTRPDGDQALGRVEMQMPPGLLGTLANVKLCPEAQANAGMCGEESLIGHTVVSAGLGNDPYTVTGGRVYITAAYGGGQYGLSIVNPADAGPFVLEEGRPVIVRAAIYVDPHTAALRVVSGPLPTILDGIPLQIQRVNVTVERPGGFTFNPTNCNAMAIAGTLSSSEGAGAAVSSPFQVTNCARLGFAPKFAVSTSGKTSRANGASLAVKLTYPTGPNYANIAKVKVDLPKQLPSRLTTLQKACLAAVFEANPANCPAGSIVGRAKAITPVLPVPLEGPAYFVSHGGEAFPSLIFVLQGYGTTVDLVGTTFISKAGITSSTFKTVPDVPVGTFELALPEGRYSALAANGNLCTSKLAMPTEFVGQNGAKINKSTHIEVEGCSGSLSVVSSKVNKRTLTLSVYAPAAGKVSAGGKGISSSSKIYSGREALTFTLKQRKAGKLTTKITLTFTSSKGKKQTKTIRARFTR